MIGNLIDQILFYVILQQRKNPYTINDRNSYLRNKTCECCGSSKNLLVYPKKYYHSINTYEKLKRQVIRELINKKMKEEEIPSQWKRNELILCSNCQFENKLRRKNQKTFTCQNCNQKNKVDKNKIISKNILDPFLHKEAYLDFVSKFQMEIDRICEKRDYSFPSQPKSIIQQDVMVLCKKCHYAMLKGKILCIKCRQHYHSPKYLNCFECQPESFKDAYYKEIEPQIKKEIIYLIEELQSIGLTQLSKEILAIAENDALTIREIEAKIKNKMDTLKSTTENTP